MARQRWLALALDQLEAIPAVAAVWLWGSGGRGDDDALSDWDIFVAWDETSDVAGLETVWCRRFGELLWWHEDLFNAPSEGRLVATGYPAPYSPLSVDGYLRPPSAAQIGTDTRVLWERSPLPRVPVETSGLFPTVTHDVEFVFRLTQLSVFSISWSGSGSCTRRWRGGPPEAMRTARGMSFPV